MAKAPKGLGKLGPKGRETPLMSKTLSKSEHSLFQPKGGSTGGAKTPLAPLAPSLGKPSRIPRGPYAEVKPLSKAPEAAVSDDGKSDDELLSSKAKAQKGSGTVPSAIAGTAGCSRIHGPRYICNRMVWPDSNRRGGPWSQGGLMPQSRGMLERWGLRVWVGAEALPYKQKGARRAEV